MRKEITSNQESVAANDAAIFHLGTHLGRHQAFGMVAARCSAADAESLRSIRQSGHYKRLGLTWEQFCSRHAGISRAYADRLIHHLEEFGANYFRMAELTEISASTYRLIAAAVTDEGVVVEGETIPLEPDHREKLAAVVERARQRAKSATESAASATGGAVLRKLLDDYLHRASSLSRVSSGRAELIVLLEEAERLIGKLLGEVRRKTLILR